MLSISQVNTKFDLMQDYKIPTGLLTVKRKTLIEKFAFVEIYNFNINSIINQNFLVRSHVVFKYM